MKLNLIAMLLFLGGLQTLNSQVSNFIKIDEYLTNYKNSIPIPGFSIVIVEHDQVVFSKGYGVEKIGSRQQMTPQTPVGVGSVGRGFTAVAIMQLAEQGLLDLDEAVVNYLPWFTTANKQFSDEITVRMCLNNTAGIPAIHNFTPDLDPSMTLEKFVRSMKGSYVKRRPGTTHEFSDEGYSIAGLLISELSGTSYPEYMDEHVFRKLKMRHTTTDPMRLNTLNVSYGHELGLDQCIPAEKEFVDSHFLPAGSELRSSTADLGHYLIALLNGGSCGDSRILSADSVEELFKANTSFRGLGTMLGGNGLDISYALGWMGMEIEDRSILIHTGNTGTMASIVGLNREKQQGIAILFNGDVNRLNRFVYPTLENTANNIIHILNSEDTTDFAVVKFDDPYDDDYTLPEEKWSDYVGHYSSFGKSSPFFREMNLEITIGKNDKLELLVTKTGNLKGHYSIQFINESRAVLRSIAHPREIQFKLFPNGTVGGLYMFGTEFNKRDDLVALRFEKVQSSDQSVSFLFPKGGNKEWDEDIFKASFDDYPGVLFELSTSPLGNKSFEQFVTDQLQSQTVQTSGFIKNVNVRDCIWTEQSISMHVDGSNRQLLFARYQDPVNEMQAQIVVHIPWGSFSSDLQEVMMRLQESIGF